METKRVSDQYKISAPAIIIDGNLTVLGSTTSVSTVNSTIEDNIITLNQGEVGAGVTEGTSGIEVDRGSENNATLLFNETDDAWESKIGSSFAILRSASPVGNNDVATKGYVTTTFLNSSPSGPLGSIQYNNGLLFAGSPNLLWNGSDLLVSDVAITTGTIRVTTTDSDLEIAANGNGKIYFKNVLRIENVAFDPISESNSNVVFSKTPGNAGSGLYFINTSDNDELVSRKKAILFGLIF